MLDLKVLERIGKKGVITYVPSNSLCSESREYFESFSTYYKYYGITKFKYFAHDKIFSSIDLKHAFNTDALYFSGGNTFYFLNSIKNKKLISHIKSYVAAGGAFLGQSAGSIIATDNINTATVGPIKDENYVKLKDTSGLRLVDVSFIPHYKPTSRIKKIISIFSSESPKKLVIAAQDGGGIIFSEGRRLFVGPTDLFFNGELLYRIPSDR